MTTRYEWATVDAASVDDMENGENDFEGYAGCGVAHLKQALQNYANLSTRGRYVEIRLVRYSFDGYENTYDDAVYHPGFESPTVLLDAKDPIPQRFVKQWNRHGAGGAA